MNKPRRIVIDPHGVMVVEYLATRRVLRMVNRTGPAPEAFELPLVAFLDRLGVKAADLSPTRHYLLFAGTDGVGGGGLRDLLGLYEGEQAARDAFRSTRLSPTYRRGWAELVVLGPGRGLEPVCWFGRARTEPGHRSPRPPERHSELSFFRRRSKTARHA